MNLILNASEALADGAGEITITTGAKNCTKEFLEEILTEEERVAGQYVYLQITDTGCGMDDESLCKIFDPFFSTKFTGRGLGLAAVQGIINGHKGAAQVSTSPGKGTVFSVYLPISGPHIESRFLIQRIDDFAKTAGTILIVDDESSIVRLTSKIFKKVGYNVLTASDGLEGINVFRENADLIDVVLLDLTMPRMDGEETFNQMLQVKEDVLVLLSSGYSEQEATSRFGGKGLAGFIQKPYTPVSLVKKIRKLLGEER